MTKINKLSHGQKTFQTISRGILIVRDIVQDAFDSRSPSHYLQAGWTPDDFSRASCLMDDMVRLSRLEPLRGPNQCLSAMETTREKTSPC